MIAIDQGKAGGIAWIDNQGVTQAVKMPEGMTAQVDFLRALTLELTENDVFLEKVGTGRPCQSSKATATFARHCGNLEAALYLLAVRAEQITPTKWQRVIVGIPKGKDMYTARKRYVKEYMQRLCPHLKVTLLTGDALAILEWAKQR